MKNLTSSFEPQQFISIPYQQILAAPNNTVWQGGAAGRAAEWKGDTSDTTRIAYLDKVTLTSCVTTILNSVLQFLHQYFDKAETG